MRDHVTYLPEITDDVRPGDDPDNQAWYRVWAIGGLLVGAVIGGVVGLCFGMAVSQGRAERMLQDRQARIVHLEEGLAKLQELAEALDREAAVTRAALAREKELTKRQAIKIIEMLDAAQPLPGD